MGILGAVEEVRRWREVYAGGKGGVEGSGKGVDIINIAGNVCVSLSRAFLSNIVTATGPRFLHLGSWHTAADEFTLIVR